MIVLYLLRALLIPRNTLVVENLVLRQQLAVLRRGVLRPRIHPVDRAFWTLLRTLWSRWRSALLVVEPSTVVRWHREGWRLLWRWRSRGRPGRPPVPLEVRELIRRLSRENRLWGAPRIQAELARLGFHAAKSTVEKYMVRRRGPPTGTWRAFLRNHAGAVLACDFFVIPTATFQTLYGFVVIELGRRRIVACDVTRHPTAQWAGSVVQRAVLSAGGGAQCLVRDRDGIYGAVFNAAMRSLGLRQMICAYRSPLQNAFAERVIGTLRRECLDHVIVFNERHARRILDEYVAYYNAERAHQGTSPAVPSG